MKFSLDNIINWLTGRAWNYQATFRYTPDANNGQMNITRIVNFHVTDRNALADHRVLKKALVPNMVKTQNKRYLTNGDLEIASISYIGWYKPRQSPKRTGKMGHKK